MTKEMLSHTIIDPLNPPFRLEQPSNTTRDAKVLWMIYDDKPFIMSSLIANNGTRVWDIQLLTYNSNRKKGMYEYIL